jgi:hypothetical protein
VVGTWIARRAESDSHAKRTSSEAGADGNTSGTGRRGGFAVTNHLVASDADTDSIVTQVADIDAAPNFHSASRFNFDTGTNADADTHTNAATNSNANPDAKSDGNNDAANNRNADRGSDSDAEIDINANAVTY